MNHNLFSHIVRLSQNFKFWITCAEDVWYVDKPQKFRNSEYSIQYSVFKLPYKIKLLHETNNTIVLSLSLFLLTESQSISLSFYWPKANPIV